MARALEPAIRFMPRVSEALAQGDLGDEVEPGFHVKSLGKISEEPTPGETETAPAKEKIKPRTPSSRAKIPREMAEQLVRHYLDTMSDPTVLNPLRDGIPQCARHRYLPGKSYGCYQGCTTDLLPRATNFTIGEAIIWVQELINFNLDIWLKNSPQLRGYVSSIVTK